MPLYSWEDKKSQKKVEVLRSFADYEVPPHREEALDMTNEEFENAEWERTIYGNQRVVRGDGWHGSKGNWVLPLLFIFNLLTNNTQVF